MIRAAGLFLINKNNELLVCHPTNHDQRFWSIPKGAIEKKETAIKAAVRETKEECGIDLVELLENNELNYHSHSLQRYTTKKKSLQPFVVYESENDIDFSSFELKCESTFENKNGNVLPEMDDWKWVDITKVVELLDIHPTQQTIIKLINNLLK